METGRLATFADGVFVIAATLLILNVDTVRPSCAAVDADLAQHLLCGWPSYVAYAVSFRVIESSVFGRDRSRGDVAP